MRAARPGRGQDGHVAIELSLGVGLLVLPMALLVLSFPVWIERTAIATAAAQEAARSVVVAASAGEGSDAAERVVAEVAANNAIDPSDLRVCLTAHSPSAPPGPCGPITLRRGAAITAHVQVRLPALSLPGLDIQLGDVVRTVSHTEHVDRYRGFP